MDQFIGIRGTSGHAIFLDCRDLSFEQVPIETGEYDLLLADSNIRHDLSSSPYNSRKKQCADGVDMLSSRFRGVQSLRDTNEDQLNLEKENLPGEIFKRCRFVIEENERVKQARKAVEHQDWKRFGQLLYESHKGLRNQYEVSTKELDFIVDYTKGDQSILGCRMIGGGFGGCALMIIKRSHIEAFSAALERDYSFEFGTSIGFYPVRISDGTRIVDPKNNIVVADEFHQKM